MRRKESLYAVIGGVVGAVVTMAVCSVMPIGAQNGDATFGEITCTGLNVVDAEGNARIMLVPIGSRQIGRVSIMSDSILVSTDGGMVHIDGDDKKGVGISVMGGGKLASMTAHRDSALVEVSGITPDTGSAVLQTGEHGGRAGVYGKGDEKARAVIAVNEYGNGAVSTWDKNGYRLATLK